MAYRDGLRASELVELRWDDVDFRTGKLHVRRGKGGMASVHWQSGNAGIAQTAASEYEFGRHGIRLGNERQFVPSEKPVVLERRADAVTGALLRVICGHDYMSARCPPYRPKRTIDQREPNGSGRPAAVHALSLTCQSV